MIETKICKDCNIEKQLTEFRGKVVTNKANEKYVRYEVRCKDCERKRSREKYQQNREKHIEASKRYYLKNYEKQRAYQNEYKRTHRDEMLDYYTDYYWENRDHILDLKKIHAEENREYYNQWHRERKILFNSLPHTATQDDIKYINDLFNNRCALTCKEDEITLEHFIPVSWGHGGTYIGNFYPLYISLNQSKRDVNPFEWTRKKRVQEEVDINKWNKLIEILAEQNNLTIQEFIEFVYWCEANKRDVDQIKADGNKTSLELWKEAKFQYNKDFN